MDISYNWLKDYINITETPIRTAEILTDLGLEIGGIETVQSIKGGLEGLVIGEVLEKTQHPNADKLSCTRINVGSDSNLSIVCGAANVAVGQKVVVATIGTVLYNGEKSFKIKKSKLRGELSEGMLCGGDEIGFENIIDGIMVLPEDAITGTLAKDYFNVETDYILDVDITPNRADALSHYGVARDLAVYFGANGNSRDLKFPELKALPKTAELPFEIIIEDKEACSRYAGISIKGVKVNDSPDWIKKKLQAIGLSPINNIVDITNFVLHETGQPLHAFDYSISGEKIIVKSNLEDVKFTTLDGIERELKNGHLMICNDSEPMCIAGVFGGEKSGVSSKTKDIFLESAYFNPVSVRKTSKAHSLKTDASYRFERGVDPNMTVKALQRAANLIIEIAGGSIASEIKDIVVSEAKNFLVDFKFSNCANLLGVEIPNANIKTILNQLEIEIVEDKGDLLKLSVPAYRVDVQRECDVIEDILRVYGYNTVKIPTSLKSSIIVNDGVPQERIQNDISNLLVNVGFNEIMNNSLTKSSYYDGLETILSEQNIELLNPLSQDLNILRRSLIFGGLESISKNQNMKNSDLKFFEFGKTYWKNDEGKYQEKKHLSILITGENEQTSWNTKINTVNYFTLKGYITLLLEKLGIKKLKTKALQNEFLVEGVGLYFKKTLVAEYGKVKKSFLKTAGVKQDVYFADIQWDEIVKLVQFVKTKFQPIAKFHPVKRDLSLLLDQNVKFSDLERIAFESERGLLKEVQLFDIYEGDKLAEGKKSYALSFILQSEENTLKDKQIEKSMLKLQNAFKEKLNAELR
jgi:phenylalanyl-tRNA synthetase beta chain